jgi:hypothetical protein
LLPIADRDALTWIVDEQRTAFSASRKRDAERLRSGDRLFLYTTRGCFRNPTRDRGRVVGVAIVHGAARPLKIPVSFGDRAYTIGVSFLIERLAPFREGVALAPLVVELATFPDPASWSARLRRALVPLEGKDGDVLARLLKPVAPPYPEALATYGAEN